MEIWLTEGTGTDLMLLPNEHWHAPVKKRKKNYAEGNNWIWSRANGFTAASSYWATSITLTWPCHLLTALNCNEHAVIMNWSLVIAFYCVSMKLTLRQYQISKHIFCGEIVVIFLFGEIDQWQLIGAHRFQRNYFLTRKRRWMPLTCR